jgi:hypothetical protein
MSEQNLGDNTYLQYRRDEMNNSSQIRMSFINYFITVNIAYLFAINYLSYGAIVWISSFSKVFISLLIIIIDFCFYRIYKRIECLAGKGRDEVLRFVGINANDTIKAMAKKRCEGYELDPTKGAVAKLIMFMLLLFSAIPFSYLITIIVNYVFIRCNFYVIENVVFPRSIFVTILIFTTITIPSLVNVATYVFMKLIDAVEPNIR